MEYKGFLIKPDKQSPKLLRIAPAGQGGKIPVSFEGLFTDVATIKTLIDNYTPKRVRGEKKNDEGVSQGGG